MDGHEAKPGSAMGQVCWPEVPPSPLRDPLRRCHRSKRHSWQDKPSSPARAKSLKSATSPRSRAVTRKNPAGGGSGSRTHTPRKPSPNDTWRTRVIATPPPASPRTNPEYTPPSAGRPRRRVRTSPRSVRLPPKLVLAEDNVSTPRGITTSEWVLAKTVKRHIEGLEQVTEAVERAQKLRRWLEIRGKSEKIDRDLDVVRDLRRWFDALDLNSSGKIDLDELEFPLMSMQLVRDRVELNVLVAAHDCRGQGNIRFEEFVDMMLDESGSKTSSSSQLYSLLHRLAHESADEEVTDFSVLLQTFCRRKVMSAIMGTPAQRRAARPLLLAMARRLAIRRHDAQHNDKEESPTEPPFDARSSVVAEQPGHDLEGNQSGHSKLEKEIGPVGERTSQLHPTEDVSKIGPESGGQPQERQEVPDMVNAESVVASSFHMKADLEENQLSRFQGPGQTPSLQTGELDLQGQVVEDTDEGQQDCASGDGAHNSSPKHKEREKEGQRGKEGREETPAPVGQGSPDPAESESERRSHDPAQAVNSGPEDPSSL